jgi:hypothetical protein
MAPMGVHHHEKGRTQPLVIVEIQVGTHINVSDRADGGVTRGWRASLPV